MKDFLLMLVTAGFFLLGRYATKRFDAFIEKQQLPNDTEVSEDDTDDTDIDEPSDNIYNT